MGGTRSSSTSRVATPLSNPGISLDDIQSGRIRIQSTEIPASIWQRFASKVDDNVVFLPNYSIDGNIDNYSLVLSDSDGTVLGRATLMGREGRRRYFSSFYVPEEHRRRGYGTRLYRAALKHIAPASLTPEQLRGGLTSDMARAVQKSLSRYRDIDLEYDPETGNVARMRYVG